MSITSGISQASMVPVAPCGDVLSQHLSQSSVTDSCGNQGASDSMAPPTATSSTSIPTTPESENWAAERSRQPSSSSLGTFYKLPAELRLIIWRNLMPELRDESEPSPEAYGSVVDESPRLGNCPAVIRTNFALFYAIRSELYWSPTLRILIRPQRRDWRAEALPGSTMANSASARFSSSDSIRVEILCPGRVDPGQLLYARAAVLGLVGVLRGYRSTIKHCELYSTTVDQRQIKAPINARTDERSTACEVIPRPHIHSLNKGTDTWHDGPLAHVTFGEGPYIDDDLEFLVDYGWKLEKKNDPQWFKEWRCKWPNGIPPRGSFGWFTVIAAASRR